MNTLNTKEKQNKYKSAQINKALGVFIFIFSLIVIFAMVFTDTFIHKMTNLIAGLVLCGIGGGMILKSRKTIKELNMNEYDNV